VEGHNVAFENRFAQVEEALVSRVAELIDLKVDVIIVAGNNPTRVASAATSTIPIVMALSNDPVGTGLVSSLAHPGRNVTGMANLSTELNAKRLELLKDVAPGVSRVALVWDPTVPGRAGTDVELGVAARALDLQMVPHPIRGGSLLGALAAASAGGADAILLLPDFLTAGLTSNLQGYFGKVRLPTIVESAEYARVGGLVAYGPSSPALFERAAVYVDKILKGARPADLPVEQPTTFDLAINLKTARALGLTIPPSILQQATEVIQ